MAATVYVSGPELRSATGAELLTLDASTMQTHEVTATATEHPVEDGADITDHVQPQLPRLTIQGVISAQSLVAVDERPGREIDGWATLTKILTDAVPVTVITSLQRYDDMVLLRVSTPRDGQQNVRPALEFRQIRRVEEQLVALPPERVKKRSQRAAAAKKQDTGRQTTKNPTTEEAAAADRSLAAIGFDLLGL